MLIHIQVRTNLFHFAITFLHYTDRTYNITSSPDLGNLYVTTSKEGKPTLALLDFGLIANVDKQARNAMTQAIVNLLQGDYDTLIAQDAKNLGFLPHDMDVTDLKPVLKTILKTGLVDSGSNLRDRKRNLMAISNELNEVFFQHPFSVPPFFALITRGLGLLEGIALSG
jgi:predicted unusual protein kinase regulating ubiquinone biosynthesis (AarF/ABC1/UbiB family)